MLESTLRATSKPDEQLLMVSMAVYAMTITTIKVSLLLFLRRIFDVSRFRTFSAVAISFCLTWFMSAILTDLLQCSSIKTALNSKLLDTDSCLPIQSWYWGITVSNVVLDVIIFLLPVWMIVGLRLSWTKKCLLCCLFSLGSM